jgi:hypothetical protein
MKNASVALLGKNSYAIIMHHLEVILEVDNRDNTIECSILFRDVPDRDKERIYCHIIVRMFGGIHWRRQPQFGNLLENLKIVLLNLEDVLSKIDNEKITPENVTYFYRGYNCGYSDSVSS